jgi:hypothetical protein
MTWNFRKKQRNEKIRNPIQGEFFATDAIAGPAQALVRESVQNSLDAAQNTPAGTAPVRIRMLLRSGSDALPAGESQELFRGAWEHYAATGNGLRDPPGPDTPCNFLVVEDFGTKGLTGDPAQSDPQPGSTNPFFLFFRAEGLSAKGGLELGRWGIGKFVFPRSSLISTHFGLTVRNDDGQRLLLGAVTLKAHRISGDEEMFSPDGLYGMRTADGFVMPISDVGQIERFRRLFGLNRTNEPGLSVVVPFADPEITFEALLSSSVRDYFVPILRGRLEILIESGPDRAELTARSLPEIVSRFAERLGGPLESFVKLARWMSQVDEPDRFILTGHDPAKAARWSDQLIPSQVITTLRARIASREPAAIRVPVTVRQKATVPTQSYFDIYLVPDKASDGRPLFVREGIIISDVRGTRAKEMRSMVVVEDKALATMLGDSENPAHTQWQKDSSNFRGKYVYGPSLIEFISTSVGQLLATLTRSAQEADPSLTVDFFSIDPPEGNDDEAEETDLERPKGRKGEHPDRPEIIVQPRATALRMRRIAGGFSIQQGSAAPPAPFLVEVRCAYDVRSGNPIKKWNAADFTLTSQSIAFTGDVRLERVKGNWLLLCVTGGIFAAEVTGFDEQRDVFVRAEVHKNAGGLEDAGQAA